MKKLRFNKKNIAVTLSCLGLGGVLIFTSANLGLHIDSNSHIPEFYYLNTKNIEMSNDELLNEFKKMFNESDILKSELSCVYPELCDFISNYGIYLDQEELLDTLPELRIDRTDMIVTDKIFGIFDPGSNKITFSNILFRKTDNEIKEVKLHEFLHYVFHQGFAKSFLNFSNRGYFLDESLVSLLVRELGCYARVDSYEKGTYYVRAICELIGSEKYMNAAGHHDLNQLVDYLNEYSDSNDGLSLIKFIDEAFSYRDSYNTEADKKAWDIIEEMYFNKNGISINDSTDVVMKIYGNKLAGKNYEIAGARGYSNAQLSKYYFMNKGDNTIIYESFGKKYGIAYLNNNNEIESGSVLVNGFYDDSGNVVDNDGNYLEPSYIEFGNSVKQK